MAHELEINPANGEASFVYNGNVGKPWHLLGTEVEGYGTPAEMLKAANADYDVWTEPVYVKDKRTGEFVEVDNRFATVRHNPFTDDLQSFEVFSNRYTVVQNAEVLDLATDIVGASSGDATIDTLGVIKDGAVFFATIDLGQVVIDPAGAHDTIGKYLMVKTSHDGSSPIVYANTNIRVVCSNTMRFALQEAKSTFKARHTPNAEGRIREAQKVLGISTAWSEAFTEMADELLGIEVPQSSARFDKVMDRIRPKADADTDRKKANRDEFVFKVKSLYGNSRNAAMVGHNGWGLYNALTEYYDWHRKGTATELVTASLDEAGLVTKEKVKAQQAILSLV